MGWCGCTLPEVVRPAMDR